LKLWPALDLPGADDLSLAALDDFSPTAFEDRDTGVRVFFASREHRDLAQAALGHRGIAGTATDVSDEDWAVRSQQNLTPITVGGVTIVPNVTEQSRRRSANDSGRKRSSDHPLIIVIEPSMGFGTGHHATTRLCLTALQQTGVAGASVLDVGTGSGILAIAAVRLGAAHALGIDSDADAIQSANENLPLNPEVRTVRFELADLTSNLPRADIVVANLTGALLARAAAILLGALNPGGTLIVSGILAAEEPMVRLAFSTVAEVWRQQEDEWVCLMLRSGQA
jgi:ribosomal protein L11 methyltransferase